MGESVCACSALLGGTTDMDMDMDVIHMIWITFVVRSMAVVSRFGHMSDYPVVLYRAY